MRKETLKKLKDEYLKKTGDPNTDFLMDLISYYYDEPMAKLEEEKLELIEALKGLQKSLSGITNAYIMTSPYGEAVRVLEKHNRYWK